MRTLQNHPSSTCPAVDIGCGQSFKRGVIFHPLVYVAIGLPFILMKQGHGAMWAGLALLAVEALFSIVAGRKLLRVLRAKTKISKPFFGVPLLLTFFAVYLGGNLLAVFVFALFFLPPL